MALVGNTSKREFIPHEAGEWVEVRLLTGAEMDEAQDSQTKQVIAKLGDMIPSAIQNAQSNRQPDDSIQARKLAYDSAILLHYAITAWSYDDPVRDNPGAQIDALTRDWLWEIIVEMNTRPPVSLPGGEPS